MVNNKLGYINYQGTVVVQPIYINGGEFSEGLAPVRKDGLFGYINANGEFAISPQFEFATGFTEGFAIVYKDGKSYFIDRSGKQLFANSYKELAPFYNGWAKVKTHTGKEGLVNTKGQLAIDTAFKAIYTFYQGVAIVEGPRNREMGKNGRPVKEFGIIDTSGKFVVPYGTYDEIKDFYNGYAPVDIDEKKNESGDAAMSGFIDVNGKPVLLRQNKNKSWIDGNLSDNRAKINLYKYWIPDRKGTLWSSDKSYEGYVNMKGDIILNDTLLEKATDFAEGRAFIKRKSEDNYFMIDTNGRKVTEKGYRKVLHDRFFNGKAFVYGDGGWSIIDRNGNYLMPPTYFNIDERGIVGDIFFYGRSVNSETENKTLYGLAKTDGRVVTPPLFEWRGYGGFVNGVMRVSIDDAPAYIDTSGTVIWKAPADNDTTTKTLNIDYMNRAHCYASSVIQNEEYSGWGRSNNLSRHVGGNEKIAGLYMNVNTSATEAINGYNQYALQVVNNSKDTVSFNAQDSRLYLVIEALDKKGEWRPIEYSPNSWCGNSYHTVALAPGYEWRFKVPVYEGEFKTKLRASLRYINPKSKTVRRTTDEKIVYSNEFDGSINLAQFWRKPVYQPGGLMDPYNE